MKQAYAHYYNWKKPASLNNLFFLLITSTDHIFTLFFLIPYFWLSSKFLNSLICEGEPRTKSWSPRLRVSSGSGLNTYLAPLIFIPTMLIPDLSFECNTFKGLFTKWPARWVQETSSRLTSLLC